MKTEYDKRTLEYCIIDRLTNVASQTHHQLERHVKKNCPCEATERQINETMWNLVTDGTLQLTQDQYHYQTPRARR